MHMTRTETTPAAAPLMPLGDWQHYVSHSIEDGGLDKRIRESVTHRMRRTHDEDDIYSLGRVLEGLAREAGCSEIGRWLLEQAKSCGSGMDERDLTRTGRL